MRQRQKQPLEKDVKKEVKAPPPVKAKDYRILIAEDNHANQELIKLLLKKTGMETEIAENGLQAIELATNNDYDIILMDIQMPEMNGHEATQKLRAQGLKTPIIAVTAHAMASDREKAIQAGCDDYLTKPIDQDKLIEMLKKYLGDQAVTPKEQDAELQTTA